VQAIAARIFGHGGERIFRRHLAERDGARILIQQRAQLAQELQILRARVVVMVILIGVWIVRSERARVTLRHRLRRVVAQLLVVKTEIDRVEPQTVDALVEPETQIVEHGAAQLAIVEIQVGL
jgi:hypothetical protein